MFDLEARIRQWRRSLTDRLGGHGDALEDLERHLREEMRRAALAGREPEAAWNDAVARLGSPDRLAREFAKLPIGRPLRWVPAWCVFVPYLLGSVALVCLLRADLAWREDAAAVVAHVGMICIGYFAVMAFAILSSMLTLSRLWGGATPQRLFCLRAWGRAYMAIGLVGCVASFVVGSILLRGRGGVVWPNDANEIGEVVMVAWTLGMLIRFSRSKAPSLVDPALGVAGNAVVGASWFVAIYVKSMYAAGVHGYGPSLEMRLVGLLTCWFAIHGLLLALAIVPFGRRQASPMESS